MQRGGEIVAHLRHVRVLLALGRWGGLGGGGALGRQLYAKAVGVHAGAGGGARGPGARSRPAGAPVPAPLASQHLQEAVPLEYEWSAYTVITILYYLIILLKLIRNGQI